MCLEKEKNMSNFISKMENELNETKIFTENGAVSYATTGKNLLDLNFQLPYLRRCSESEIYSKFMNAYAENSLLALKWLFFVRDVRGGMGERRTFRAIIKKLACDDPEIVSKLISIIPDYGRYDDLLCLLDTPIKDKVASFFSIVIRNDNASVLNGRPSTLCAKWMPSVSSKKDRKYALMLAKSFGITEKAYRKTLSFLRSYIGVTETYMSENKWGYINYSEVPSKANLNYNQAFLKHDKERREEFLKKANDGEVKVNSSTLYPYEITCKYRKAYYYTNNGYDENLEAAWKNLPNLVKGNNTTLCVVDGSGSMFTSIPNSSALAVDVSNGLGVYFAERCNGEFKNKFITFGASPKLVDLGNDTNLLQKLRIAYSNDDCSNTNIEKVFDLILNTAVKNKMSQEDLPKNVLMISDMEFDCAHAKYYSDYDKTLFETISKKFKDNGYKLPRLVFWNVNSRTNAIPMQENENGVALVSGFSTNVLDMVLSNEFDPYKCLINKLNSERYDEVEKCIKYY
jgi:hypothetical protein